MGLPTSPNIVTVSSATTMLRGNKLFSIEMEIQGTSAASETMKISSIGKYGVDLNIQEDASEVNQIFYNVAEFKFSFFSNLASGTNFFTYLTSLTFTDLIKITVSYDSVDTIFICQANDFQYKERERMVEVTCYSPLKYNEQVTAFDTSDYEIPVRYNDGSLINSYNVITIRDLIQSYLESWGQSTNIILSDFTVRKTNLDALTVNAAGNTLGLRTLAYPLKKTNQSSIDGKTDEITDGEFVVASTTDSSGLSLSKYDQARGRVLEAGIAESAIIGTFYGKSFYVRRDSTTGAISISESNIESLEVEYINSAVRSINVIIGSIESGNRISSSSLLNRNLTQTILINVPDFGNTMNIYKPFAFAGTFALTDPRGGYNETDLGLNLASNCLQSYKNALVANDIFKYKITLFGAGNIMPYDILRLPTSVSEFIDTSNRDVRLSKLEYDFVNDKTYIECYQV